MPSFVENINRLNDEKTRKLFKTLYGDCANVIDAQIDRYKGDVKRYGELFSQDDDIEIFSTPGRTEIGGNHTDHNHGKVLAAGVDLDSVGIAAKTDDNIIKVYSKGYDTSFVVDISDLDVVEEEKGTTNALIRGVAAGIKERGYTIGGFNAYMDSRVLPGSGLSSSASIEVLLGTMMGYLYNDGTIDAKELAMIGQYAENKHFGKPCGLMDQMACAVGGFVNIDFKEANRPIVNKIDFDFASRGYSLLVVDTGGNHSDLTADYAAVPEEMKAVARALGGDVCREFSMDQLIGNIKRLRTEVGDRAILRAMHFFSENERVDRQVEALEQGDFDRFLDLILQSGSSSWRWLQNCYATHNPEEQGITLALALTEQFVMEHGYKAAYRVHGGGFAGTMQAFLPNEGIKAYISLMEQIFGEDCVTVLGIRPHGTLKI